MKKIGCNKTLLPLIPAKDGRAESHPILMRILSSLPPGPKAVVVNYRKEDVLEATRGLDLTYCEQPDLNGTGGALLTAWTFLEKQICDKVIITMGDVPFVEKATYLKLIKNLNDNSLVVLGFRPEEKKQYGMLEIDGDHVTRIIEWHYLQKLSEKNQQDLEVCNSGIYAVRTEDLLQYLSVLESRPHKVPKNINGQNREVKEYFITDLIEYMSLDGLSVGFMIVKDEEEVMGIDDPAALAKAQGIFAAKIARDRSAKM